eukprot:6808883-Prymnesium_polylepis.1
MVATAVALVTTRVGAKWLPVEGGKACVMGRAAEVDRSAGPVVVVMNDATPVPMTDWYRLSGTVPRQPPRCSRMALRSGVGMRCS